MVLAHTDETPARVIHTRIRVTHLAWRRQCLGRVETFLPVKSLVGKVRKLADSLVNQIIAAAIFVNTGASVERGGIDIGSNPIRAPSDYDITARLLRPHLQPVNVVSIKQRLTEAHRSFNDQTEVIGDFQEPNGAIFGEFSKVDPRFIDLRMPVVVRICVTSKNFLS